MVVIDERMIGVDRADILGVADNAVAPRQGAGPDRRGINPGHGRKHRMAVGEIDALLAQPPEVRRLLRRYGIGPQAVEHEDDVECGPAGVCGKRGARDGRRRETNEVDRPEHRRYAHWPNSSISLVPSMTISPVSIECVTLDNSRLN